MGFLSCLSASKTDEMMGTPTECSAEKAQLSDCCTQTDVPEMSWLKEALVVSSQSLPITQASGLSHDSLSASALRSPSVHVAGEARCENEPLSARMLESPSSMPPSQEQSHVETLMVASDGTHDEGVVQVKAELKRVFLEFAQFGTRSEAKAMDVYRFTKLCRECDLLAQPQDTPSINLIFYKCKGTKTSKLTFGQFKMALRVIADYLNWDLARVHARIAQSDGPLVNNITLPRYVKQHDSHATGGSPTAAQREAMTQSFMAGIGAHSPSTMGATPRGATPRGVGVTPRGTSTMGGTCLTPTAAVRRARTQGPDFGRNCSTTPVSAWR